MQRDSAPSIEGFLTGQIAGHYRLIRPVLIEAPDRSHDLQGEVWVDRSDVLFIQVLP